LFALQRAGFPMGDPNGAHIMQRIHLYSWLASGVVTFGTHPDWNFDASPPSAWNQFGIVFGADFTPPVGSVFQDGDPSAALLNSIVAAWKPAKARFMGSRVQVAGPWWDWPVGVAWDDVGRDWGDGVTTGLSRFVAPTRSARGPSAGRSCACGSGRSASTASASPPIWFAGSSGSTPP